MIANPTNQVTDEEIVHEIINWLEKGKTNSEIQKLLLEKYESSPDFDPIFTDLNELIEQGQRIVADKYSDMKHFEENTRHFADEVLNDSVKLLVENYCHRNNKRMPTDPTKIERLYDYLKKLDAAEKRTMDSIAELENTSPAFPRLSGSLSDLADALCPDIPYEFKVMAAVTYFGLIRSGLDKLENEPHLQPRFYTALIAVPGIGKTAAINEVRSVMNFIKPPSMSVMSSVDSGPALVDEFAQINASLPPGTIDTACRILLDPDELSDVFEKSKVTAQSRNSLAKEFLRLYETNITGNRTRQHGKKQVDNGHLAILGGCTPEGYQIMWAGTGGASGGLQSRFVTIMTDRPTMPIERAQSDGKLLNNAIQRIQAQAAQPEQVIRIDDEAKQMLRDWWAEYSHDKGSQTRVDDFVKRLLIVLAATNGVTVVGKDLMEQAIRFGDYVILIREKVNPADSWSWAQSFENDIRAMFKKHERDFTENEIRRLIHPERKPGGLRPFGDAWKNLIAAGEIKQIVLVQSYGPKTARYEYVG